MVSSSNDSYLFDVTTENEYRSFVVAASSCAVNGGFCGLFSIGDDLTLSCM